MPGSKSMPTPGTPITAPYGTWASSLSAQTVAAGALRLGNIAVDGDDVYWVEGRPDEGGRSVVVRRSADGHISDATPAGTNVRTRVHEYGGAAYAVAGGVLYYSEFSDHRLYRLVPGGVPEPLTPPGDWFYADCVIDAARGRLVCVREDHTVPGAEPVTAIVGVPLDGPPSPGDVLVAGHDFYLGPRFSPDHTHVCWVAWRHPQMPWDGTELWLARVSADGRIEPPSLVAGGEADAIFQPGWSPDGTLYFVSDRTGWWNLYRLAGGRIEPVHPRAAEFGRPVWQLGTRTWTFADATRLVVTYGEQGRWRLATIELPSGRLRPLAADVEPADSLAATRTHVFLVGGSPRAPDAVLEIDLATGVTHAVRAASAAEIGEEDISLAEAIEFETDGGLTAHAFYYPPRNPAFEAPLGEQPPLVVFAHGGPTASTYARLSLEVQYWTSRGFAVADVNYGGSAGFGRAYRNRLKEQWGIVDVADVVNAARHLAVRGRGDAARMAIRGRSAGGFTTLSALTLPDSVFSTGTSYYGVADLERLAQDTHKFESRYLDGLIGPYPERRDLYRARSPIDAVDRLSTPLLLFQGLEDRVVPPDQSAIMAAAVRAKGLPVALVTFEGEQHGFRMAASIVRCLEVELFFYGAVFCFVPAGQRPQFTIDNLDRAADSP
jgi:dipeptidyl aminopeptidase/acylaminoacyl peptidase